MSERVRMLESKLGKRVNGGKKLVTKAPKKVLYLKACIASMPLHSKKSIPLLSLR